MKDDAPSNIFDHASKKKPQAPPPVRKNELEEMFKKVHSLKDEVDAKLAKVADLSGMSRQDIMKYLENPNNFPPHIWEKMEKDRKAAEDTLYNALGTEAKETKVKKGKDQQEKHRRGKTLGARKKWLQM